ncbi:hypothetical protein HRbin02_01533 [Candidatus Calditenuaceae archaeon HR02]|nr:hypothetical protein HRbin02_01533 [Candidatus Calditenuaceae archaeon HR02]
MSSKTRPTGVTVLAILEIIGAILSLLAAMAFFALGALAGAGSELGVMGGLFAAFGVAFGGLLLILALIGFVIAYGFWTGKGWAWILGIIFSIIGIIIGLVSIIGNPTSIIGIIINGLILYYLTRPHVKAWFGKA